MSQKVCVILIGLPGSGKSTRTSTLRSVAEYHGLRVEVCSTDDFFMKNGRYEFNPGKLMEYHARNFQKFALACADGIEQVIVDNTNLIAAHREPYIRLAKALGYEVREEVIGEFNDDACQTYAARNVHGVPLDGLRRMAAGAQLPRPA